MTVEKIYTFLHKQIRNYIPGKYLQRRFIESLRRYFFPVLLEESYTSLEKVTAGDKAREVELCGTAVVPPSMIHSVQDNFVQRINLPARTFLPVNAVTLDNGYCFRNFVMDDSRRFISDATTQGLWHNLYRNNATIRASAGYFLNKNVVALTTTYTDNYYHWFADIIGRLLMLPNYEDYFFYSDLKYPYQLETLELLGIPPSHIVPMTDYSLLWCRNCTVLGAAAEAHPQALKKLQGFSRSIHTDPNVPKRLYISRADTRNRRGIANEEELLPVLRSFGFERVLFSGVPVAQQIATLRQADYVIFPQGAAAVNMAFCRPETSFLEIYSPLLPDATGVGISAALGLTHHVIEGTALENAVSAQSLYYVAPELLHNALKKLVAHP